jgi:hypothetical protein
MKGNHLTIHYDTFFPSLSLTSTFFGRQICFVFIIMMQKASSRLLLYFAAPVWQHICRKRWRRLQNPSSSSTFVGTKSFEHLTLGGTTLTRPLTLFSVVDIGIASLRTQEGN